SFARRRAGWSERRLYLRTCSGSGEAADACRDARRRTTTFDAPATVTGAAVDTSVVLADLRASAQSEPPVSVRLEVADDPQANLPSKRLALSWSGHETMGGHATWCRQNIRAQEPAERISAPGARRGSPAGLRP